MPSPTPHLSYFAVRGRAEVGRLILEETATPYTERRVALEKVEESFVDAQNDLSSFSWSPKFADRRDEYARLLDFRLRIASRPRIAAYLASARRPRTLTVHLASFGGTPETS